MNLDDKYIYVFVRQNMFQDHQMVHTFHLGFLIGKAVEGFCQKRHNVTGHPSVLLFGQPDEAGLGAVTCDLKKLGVEFIEWVDPDSPPGHDDHGLVGIVTEPLSKAFRNKLQRYRPWSERNNVHKGGIIARGAVADGLAPSV